MFKRRMTYHYTAAEYMAGDGIQDTGVCINGHI